MVKTSKAYDKAIEIARLASEKKARNIVLMDMRELTPVCEWFVIVSTGTPRSVHAIANSVRRTLSREKISPLNTERRPSVGSGWALLDYEDVVLHVFTDDVRDFYGLERLWADAPRERYTD